RNTRRLPRIGGIEAQHEAVVLDRRAAAGCRDDDGVQPALLDLFEPDVDIAPRRLQRLLLASHMVDERAAADLAGRRYDLDAEAGEQTDRRLVDLWLQHRLGAAGKDRHPRAAWT